MVTDIYVFGMVTRTHRKCLDLRTLADFMPSYDWFC